MRWNRTVGTSLSSGNRAQPEGFMSTSFLTVAVALALTVPLRAQVTTAPRAPAPWTTRVVVGDTVRAWSRTPRLAGSVRRVTGVSLDSLTVGVALRQSLRPADSSAVFPWTTLTRLDIQVGRRASSGAPIALGTVGLLSGALIGGFVSSMLGCNRCHSEYGDLGRDVGAVLIGAGIGLTGGMWLGLRSTKPVWEPVPLPTPRAIP
jgi:hypothetical protein